MARKLTINSTIPIEIQRSLRQLAQWSGADEGHINDLKKTVGAAGRMESDATGDNPHPQAQSVASLLSSKIGTLVNFRGTWSATIAYIANDMVISSGNAYLNLKACTGVPVSNTAFWFKLGGGGGGGGVTSVGLTMPAEFTVAGSPVTSSGTLAVTSANEGANTFWGGPSTGAPSTPGFRTILTNDLPTATSSTLGIVKPDNSTITISAGVISASGGGAGGSIIGSANFTVVAGVITSPTYKGVVTGVTRTASGRYTVAMSGVTGTNYLVVPMMGTVTTAYTILNIDPSQPFTSSAFSYQTVNQSGSAFLDASPTGFIIVQ